MRVDAHHHLWRYEPVEYGWIDGSMAVLQRDLFVIDLECEAAAGGNESFQVHHRPSHTSPSPTLLAEKHNQASQESKCATLRRSEGGARRGIPIEGQSRHLRLAAICW
jgi:hypothetical protein